jgi:hypothetical protein
MTKDKLAKNSLPKTRCLVSLPIAALEKLRCSDFYRDYLLSWGHGGDATVARFAALATLHALSVRGFAGDLDPALAAIAEEAYYLYFPPDSSGDAGERAQ